MSFCLDACWWTALTAYVQLLSEEITPKLDKLRIEKHNFLEYQKMTSELERLTRLAKAYEWVSHRTRLAERDAALDAKRAEREAQVEEQTRLRKQISSLEKELAKIERQRDAEAQKGGKMTALLEQSKTHTHDLTKLQTSSDFKRAAVKEEQARAKAVDNALTDLRKAHATKEKEHEKLNIEYTALRSDYDKALDGLTKDEELLQTLTTGMSSANGKAANQGGYMGLISDARARDAQAASEIEQHKMKAEHLAREVVAKEKSLKTASKEQDAIQANLLRVEREEQALALQLQENGFDPQARTQLQEERNRIGRHVRELAEKRDGLASRLSGLDFSYSDPTPNFDRSKVKGLVAHLVQLDADKAKYATALEVCAGGRLYNVVVEDEKVGSALLSKGQLRKRVTLIPLNKINAFVASAQKVGAAQQLAPGKVDLALSLVGSDKAVAKALEYVFGATLICADAATAKRVTFDNAVRLKSVTLDGDVYDPAGTLSGGSKPSTAGILLKAQQLNAASRALTEAQRELAKVEQSLSQAEQAMARTGGVMRDHQRKTHEIALLKDQLATCAATRIQAELDQARESQDRMAVVRDEAIAAQAQAQKDLVHYQQQLDEFGADKEGKILELRRTIKDRKRRVDGAREEVKSRANLVRTRALELEQSVADVAAAEEQVLHQREVVAKAQAEVAEHDERLTALQEATTEVEAALMKERAALTAYDQEFASFRDALKDKRQAVEDGEVVIKQLDHDLDKLETDLAGSAKHLKALEKQYDWLVTDEHSLGKPGGPYDFASANMKTVMADCTTLEERQRGFSSKVNPSVMSTIDSVEKKETALKRMVHQISADKAKINDTIAELDRYKKDALDKTWRKVNGDFGEIFAELLPGNYAKLQPPEGQELIQGLEVKVRLGSVWKQSLTELSGGQRSLIALSLIMSLLQFKPAPMYILDEIDAALDLSHTQHIGQLFKHRFHGSQFIVVSLKEGLFTNANVLFRARFRDGTSVVERVVQSQGGKGRSLPAVGGKENVPATARRARA